MTIVKTKIKKKKITHDFENEKKNEKKNHFK